jgi:hypothetical protein
MATVHIHPSDIRGFTRLLTHAATGVTDMVEAVHHTVTFQPRPKDPTAPLRTRGITGFVYQSVRNVTQVVGGAFDLSLAPVVAMLDQIESTEKREALLAAVNGVIGDQLAATHNPLAIKMTLRQHDPAAFDPYNRKLIIFIHGLCMNDRQWARQGGRPEPARWPPTWATRRSISTTTAGCTSRPTATRSPRCWKTRWPRGRSWWTSW